VSVTFTDSTQTYPLRIGAYALPITPIQDSRITPPPPGDGPLTKYEGHPQKVVLIHMDLDCSSRFPSRPFTVALNTYDFLCTLGGISSNERPNVIDMSDWEWFLDGPQSACPLKNLGLTVRGTHTHSLEIAAYFPRQRGCTFRIMNRKARSIEIPGNVG
jgi:hypothetical protein